MEQFKNSTHFPWTNPYTKKFTLKKGVTSQNIHGRTCLTGKDPQAEVFRLADEDGHTVCVVFQLNRSSYFTSFCNYDEFLDYYISFKSTRCFYSIDRSYTVAKDTSLLHFCIE